METSIASEQPELQQRRFLEPFEQDSVFAILASTAFFVPLIYCTWLYEKYETIKIIVFGILVGVALVMFLAQKRTFRYSKFFTYLLAAFGGWLVLSTIASQDIINSILGFADRWTGLVFFIEWIIYLLLLVAVLDREKFTFLMKVVFYGAVFASSFIIPQAYGFGYYEGIFKVGYMLRPSTFLGNPDFTAMYLAALLPFGIIFYFQSRGWVSKIFYVVANFFVIFAIVLLVSRGAFLGLGISFLAFFILGFYYFWRSPAAGSRGALKFGLFALALFAMLAGVFYGPLRSQDIYSGESVHERIDIWKAAVKSIKDSPVFGTGLGNFIFTDQLYRQDYSVVGSRFDDSHNVFLNFGSQAGLPAALIFLAIILYALKVSFIRLRSGDLTALALFSGLLGFMVSMNFSPVPSSCWLLLGIFLAGIFQDEKIFELILNSGLKVAGYVFGAAIIVFSVLFLGSEFFYFKVVNAAALSNYNDVARYAQESSQLNPLNQYALFDIVEGKIQAGDYTPASVEQQISKAVSMHPRDGLTYSWAAKLYQLLYDRTHNLKYQQATLASADQGIKVDGNNPIRYERAAYYYILAGNNDQALKYLSTDLKIYPDDLEGYLMIAKVQAEKGDFTDAIGNIKQAHMLRIDQIQLKHIWEGAKSAKNPAPFFRYSLDIGPVQ